MPTQAELTHWFERALNSQNTGNYKEALKFYKKIQKIDPDNPTILQNMGITAAQLGQIDAGIKLLNRAISKAPTIPDIPFNKGHILLNNGRFKEAIESFKIAIEINPEFMEAIAAIGEALIKLAEFSEGLKIYNQLIERWPEYAEFYSYKGICLAGEKRFDEALVSFDDAIKLKPDFVDSYANRGSTLRQQNKLEQALTEYKQAIVLDDKNSDLYFDQSLVFSDLGQIENAINSLDIALSINKNSAEIYAQKGLLMLKERRFGDAVNYYKSAIRYDPKQSDHHLKAGIAQVGLGDLKNAYQLYLSAIKLDPKNSAIYENLGDLHIERGAEKDAVINYKKAVKLAPMRPSAAFKLLRQFQNTCAWDELEELEPVVNSFNKQAIKEQTSDCESPFNNISRCDNQSEILLLSKAYCKQFDTNPTTQALELTTKGQRLNEKKTTIGYLTSDLHDTHPVAHLISSMFGLHNRDSFKVITFSGGPDFGGVIREKVKKESDLFFDIALLSDESAANLIKENDVDILIELNGHTGKSRLGVCSYRPAPIQISYLGYTGTTGANFIDYIILDKISVPPTEKNNFSENIIYLPHTFLINDYSNSEIDNKKERNSYNLPENQTVFCCFCAPHKYEKIMFDVWMKILKRVDKSVIWFLSNNDDADANLVHEAKARGISADRLIFAERCNKSEHLNRLRLADIALDTRIFGGHATTADALWASVPVITLMGKHFASRAASSILQSHGLSELVTHTLVEYERLSITLAKEPKRLEKLRSKIEVNKNSSPLFNTEGHVRELERAYDTIRAKYVSEEYPA